MGLVVNGVYWGHITAVKSCLKPTTGNFEHMILTGKGKWRPTANRQFVPVPVKYPSLDAQYCAIPGFVGILGARYK